MNWFGVVNPHAGRKRSPLAEVVALADELRLDAEFAESRSVEDLQGIVSDAVAAGRTNFVSVGGDGTAHYVVNAIMSSDVDRQCTLAIVPAGSGSDFIRTFGHGRGVRAGMERLAEPSFYEVDIGRAEGSFGTRYFLNALNLGVAAASAATAHRLPRWIGSARYTTAFWVALGRFHSGNATVEIDHHSFEGEAINIVIANGQFFGGGLNIAPRSILGDGKMDVQVFLGPRRQAFSLMPRVMRGTHLTHRGVRRYSGSRVRVDVPNLWPVEADGEILGDGDVLIDVLPEAVRFVI